MRVLVNGESTELADGATVQAAVEALDLPASGRGVAVAVDAEVVPARSGAPTSCRRGAGRDPARDPGRLTRAATNTTPGAARDDGVARRRTTRIGDRELRSRLLLGTGGFRSLDASRPRSRPAAPSS